MQGTTETPLDESRSKSDSGLTDLSERLIVDYEFLATIF